MKLSIDAQAQRANRLARALQAVQAGRKGIIRPEAAWALAEDVVRDVDAIMVCEIRRCTAVARFQVSAGDKSIHCCQSHAVEIARKYPNDNAPIEPRQGRMAVAR